MQVLQEAEVPQSVNVPHNFGRWIHPQENVSVSDPGELTTIDVFAGGEDHLKVSEVAERLLQEKVLYQALTYGNLLYLRDEQSERTQRWINDKVELFAFAGLYADQNGQGWISSVIFAGRGVAKPCLNVSMPGRWLPRMAIPIVAH